MDIQTQPHPAVQHPKTLAKKHLARFNSFNTRLAVLCTKAVGSMWCAYLFAFLAFTGLKTALEPRGIGLSNWIAEEFLQLVLLSVIMVGQNVIEESNKAKENSDHRALTHIANVIDLLADHAGIESPADTTNDIKSKLPKANF